MLLLGTILCGGIYAYTPVFHPPATPIINENHFTYLPDAPSPTPAPDESEVISKESLAVRGISITLGESADNVLQKLGAPSRIDDTEYDFDYYVYNNDYSRLVYIAMKENSVVGFYSDSSDFNYNGVHSGSALSDVEKAFDLSLSLDEVLTLPMKDYTVKILMDKLVTHKVTGVYVLSLSVKQEGYSDLVMKNIELMVYDLTNSIRVRNQEEVLSWSSSAALSARKHSIDMAEHGFFDHVNLKGQKPGERIRAEGISYNTYGENIIAGYGTAILSSHGWFNSANHRKNLLNAKFRYLGVGFTYLADSTYETYITQNFYR